MSCTWCPQKTTVLRIVQSVWRLWASYPHFVPALSLRIRILAHCWLFLPPILCFPVLPLRFYSVVPLVLRPNWPVPHLLHYMKKKIARIFLCIACGNWNHRLTCVARNHCKDLTCSSQWSSDRTGKAFSSQLIDANVMDTNFQSTNCHPTQL